MLRRRTFFSHESGGPDQTKDLTWLRADGGEMTPAEWGDPSNHVLGMLIGGDASDEIDQSGPRLQGHPILLLLNGGGRTKSFSLPTFERPGTWAGLIHTSPRPPLPVQEGKVMLVPHSLLLLRYEG
jgi:glycogen operon protein